MTKSMAEMTPEERMTCPGMWADVSGFTKPTPIVEVFGEEVSLLYYNTLRGNCVSEFKFSEVYPRFDLRRWADEEGNPFQD